MLARVRARSLRQRRRREPRSPARLPRAGTLDRAARDRAVLRAGRRLPRRGAPRRRAPRLGAAIGAALRARTAPPRRRPARPAARSGGPPGSSSSRTAGSTPARARRGSTVCVTGCTLAIAETGTIVLERPGRARGAGRSRLVPDLHVCVVDEDQMVELVPEAIDAVAELVTASGARSPSSPGRRRPPTSS